MKEKFKCSKCNFKTLKWMGQCPHCKEWNSFEESEYYEKLNIINSEIPKSLAEIEIKAEKFINLGNKELERVLGKGLVQNSITLLSGEPGIGKSTLLLEMIKGVLGNNKELNVLYISGEETESQVAQRCKRIDLNSSNLFLSTNSNWITIKNYIERLKPKLIILDSIQTISFDDFQSKAGSISQIKEGVNEIVDYIKKLDIACILIGHITKSGELAGPKSLEHMVDTVLKIEMQNRQIRTLRSLKNRFGSTKGVGFFEFKNKTLISYKDSNGFRPNNKEIRGQSYGCFLEGERILYNEVQSLVLDPRSRMNNHACSGYDSKVLRLLLAVLDKSLEEPFMDQEIYLNIKCHTKKIKRVSDLSVVSSIMSSFYKKEICSDTVFLGEITLTGEIKEIESVKYILENCVDNKFYNIVGNIKGSYNYPGVEITRVKNLNELKSKLF